jgi:hypothetical protein
MANDRVAGVKINRDTLTVSLMDGRTISVPLAWYPRLFNATAAQRKNWQIAGGGYGIYWPDVDEDLSTEGLLRGAPAPRPASKKQSTKKRKGEPPRLRKSMLRVNEENAHEMPSV